MFHARSPAYNRNIGPARHRPVQRRAGRRATIGQGFRAGIPYFGRRETANGPLCHTFGPLTDRAVPGYDELWLGAAQEKSRPGKEPPRSVRKKEDEVKTTRQTDRRTAAAAGTQAEGSGRAGGADRWSVFPGQGSTAQNPRGHRGCRQRRLASDAAGDHAAGGHAAGVRKYPLPWRSLRHGSGSWRRAYGTMS